MEGAIEEASETNSKPLAERPNILFLLSDDQPWDGLAVRMDPEISASAWAEVKTPTLDALAEQGRQLRDISASVNAGFLAGLPVAQGMAR